MWNVRVVQRHDEHQHALKLTGTVHMVIIVTFGSIWLSDVGYATHCALTRLIWILPRIAEPMVFFSLLCSWFGFLSAKHLTWCGKDWMSDSTSIHPHWQQFVRCSLISLIKGFFETRGLRASTDSVKQLAGIW